MAKRLNISLSDKAEELLQSLAQDCGMSVSQCLNQLVLRNHTQFRALFALSDTDLHTITPTNTKSDTTLHTITPTDVIPCNPVSNIDPAKEMDFMSLIANS